MLTRFKIQNGRSKPVGDPLPSCRTFPLKISLCWSAIGDPSPPPLFLNDRLLLASLVRDSTLLYNSGKNPNLSDVRSDTCAVDWFSYYLGYTPVRWYHVKRTWTRSRRDFELIFSEQADYKRDEQVIAFYCISRYLKPRPRFSWKNSKIARGNKLLNTVEPRYNEPLSITKSSV